MTGNYSYIGVLVLPLCVGAGWDLFAEPKADQTTTNQSASAVSSDSYTGLSGEEL
jgi:hypothetical protein